jgi:hypothetical protein
MRVKRKYELGIKMGGVSVEGTSCQGYVLNGARYRDLIRVFGKPQKPDSLDGKVKVIWVGTIDGFIFTIYDYKSKIVPKNNTDWHIGGKVRLVEELVNLYFFARC